MKAQFPGIEITLLIANKARVIQRVLSQEVELGFVGPPRRLLFLFVGISGGPPVSAFQCIEGLRNFCSHS